MPDPPGVILKIIILGTALTAVCICEKFCDSPRLFKSPYITARYEQFYNTSSCLSQQTTTTSQEVHVIRLQNGGGQKSKRHGPEVLLVLKKNEHSDNKVRPMIFVLSSKEPITWKLQSLHTRTVQHTVVLPTKSRVLRNPNINMEIIRNDSIPHDSVRNLRRWVRNKFHAITSYTGVDTANVIYQTVEIDSNSPKKCIIDNQKQNAGLFKMVSTWGCANPSNSGKQRDVHVIELHNIEKLVNNSQDVQLRLRTRSGQIFKKKLVIVLKSEQPTRWRLDCRHIRGNILIITNGKIELLNEHDVSVEFLDKEMPNSRRELLNMVKLRFQPAVTYTRIMQATILYLYVDGRDDISNRMRLPNLKKDKGEKVSVDETIERSGKVLPPSLGKLPASHIKARLKQAMRLQCDTDKMVVYLHKKQLQMHGVRPEQLSLADHACGAAENGTHFVLSTSLGGCKTKIEQEDHKFNYLNKVVLKRSSQPKQSSEDEMEDDEHDGSGVRDDDTAASGHMQNDQTFIDDEDFSYNNQISVDFGCNYSAATLEQFYRRSSELSSQKTASQRSRTGEENLKFDLSFYHDKNYSSKITGKPFCFIERATVFVEATLVNPLPNLRPVIHDCILQRSSDQNIHYLIMDGCQKERSVNWLSDYSPDVSDGDSKQPRFSFMLYSFLKPEFDESYLKCNLTVCNTDQTHNIPDIKKCLTQKQYCFKEKVRNEPMKKNYFKSLGPIKIKSSLKDDPTYLRPESGNSEVGKISFDEEKKNRPGKPASTAKDESCHVTVEGLHSGTVVAIAFAAFCIGALLTAALWCIHAHTGPNRRKPTMIRRSAESSGQSTPSSSAPIST